VYRQKNKKLKNFQIPLDKKGDLLYHTLARVLRVDAMKQEIAAQAGNFCGVCPLIGRLKELISRRISPGIRLRPAIAGLFYGPE
jgi:hypothetical protein